MTANINLLQAISPSTRPPSHVLNKNKKEVTRGFVGNKKIKSALLEAHINCLIQKIENDENSASSISFSNERLIDIFLTSNKSTYCLNKLMELFENTAQESLLPEKGIKTLVTLSRQKTLTGPMMVQMLHTFCHMYTIENTSFESQFSIIERIQILTYNILFNENSQLNLDMVFSEIIYALKKSVENKAFEDFFFSQLANLLLTTACSTTEFFHYFEDIIEAIITKVTLETFERYPTLYTPPFPEEIFSQFEKECIRGVELLLKTFDITFEPQGILFKKKMIPLEFDFKEMMSDSHLQAIVINYLA
ncbi:MAG: hypothetical protein WCP39_01490 [Chlamydiota bacterium]